MTYRVLLATDTLVYDGAERQFALTATNLPAGWEVRCFSAGGGPFVDHLRERGVWLQVAERRWHSDPLPFLRLWALAARWRPHVVHSWGYMTTLAGSPAFRALGIPYVDATIRTGDLDLYRGSRRTTGMDKATLVAANTRCGLEAAGVAPERGRVIPNGFDFGRIPAAPAALAPAGVPPTGPATPPGQPPARPDDRFTVVMTGRMDGIKDYPCLFEAARLLAAQLRTEAGAAPGAAGLPVSAALRSAADPPATDPRDGPSAAKASLRFRVLGAGPERPALEARAKDLVDAGILEFGYSPDVVGDLLTADCGVLLTTPPKVEGCSNSILEYMACGLPVVAGRGGGNDELLEDGQTGFLVAPADPGEVAARLRWIYDNREAARAMGARGAQVVRERHSLDTMIRATEDLYRDAMARGRRA